MRNTDPGEQTEQFTGGGEHSESGTRARGSDELACKLAYECAWRLCGGALQTLESERTRAFTLLSVTMVVAGIAVSAFLRDDVTENLGCVGTVGLIVFAVGAFVVMACAVVVAWPIMTEAALLPSAIIGNYVTPQDTLRSETWVHKHLARDLEKAYNTMQQKLTVRNIFYKWSVACAPIVLVGAGMVVLDVVL